MQDLTPDIIGTNPKYSPIVNHDWLTPQAYDNYPSDNNSVRILPKLADLWSHNQTQTETGISLIPNMTVQHTANRDVEVDVTPVVKEAKKALMAGLKGKELADYLRTRFASDQILKAKDALATLSQEQGLLGNVYIDASAFSSAEEAEQFMARHRTRLAQDIVINESQLNPAVVDVLAHKFHKNVVGSIKYDENLFQKYRAHLQVSGVIPKSFVIDSKETLRQAFLAEPVKKQAVMLKEDEKKPADPKDISKDIQERAEKASDYKKQADDELLYWKVRPIVEFACKRMAEGKSGDDLKGILRGKYASVDLNEAAKYLALVVSCKLNSEAINKLVEGKKISDYVGTDLIKLGKKYPVKHLAYEEKKVKPTGVRGFLYTLSGKSSN